jgi:hypothetical protein
MGARKSSISARAESTCSISERLRSKEAGSKEGSQSTRNTVPQRMVSIAYGGLPMLNPSFWMREIQHAELIPSGSLAKHLLKIRQRHSGVSLLHCRDNILSTRLEIGKEEIRRRWRHHGGHRTRHFDLHKKKRTRGLASPIKM